MIDPLQAARQITHIFLDSYDKVTRENIETEADKALAYPHYGQVDRAKLIEQLIADFGVYSGEATSLVDENIVPWVAERKVTQSDWPLWARYATHMKSKDPGFPVRSLDILTDTVLDKCVDPARQGTWDRRGMVVGHVQSGKTSNFIGLINKSVDAGYKLIIVIAGIHNSLRSQTQLRVDEGFIGRKSADFIELHRKIKTGVGEYHVDTEIFSYTSSADDGDFKKIIAERLNVPVGGHSPTVLVIKKNKSILENLIDWLSRYSVDTDEGFPVIQNIPLLVIDDEADNASVNSGKDINDIRTINRLIRTLLTLFQKKTFIGYTATPYANIFIPEEWNNDQESVIGGKKFRVGEDLFPRDFIVNIPAPSNYIGAARIFGYENPETGEGCEGLDIVRPADDQEPYFPKTINKTNKGNLPDDVPASLYEAVQSFILTCAVRRLRGQENVHNSMLVHVALYVSWIDRVAKLVDEILEDYRGQIKAGKGSVMTELQALYQKDFIETTRKTLTSLGDYSDAAITVHNWEDVRKELRNAVIKIEVRAVHGTRNTSQLEYHNVAEINYELNKKTGLSVIAVGGNRLARGITLEGLSVSYYLRTSRMYDSLMQMGRWFGYRPGYADLCRLYTTDQLISWYRHVTVATQEMRADFDEMAGRNKKPSDYRLKVRTHSGQMTITAASKMRKHEIIRVGFSGSFKQTYEFSKEQITIKKNLDVLQSLISDLPAPFTDQGNKFYWKGSIADKVAAFIENYQSEVPGIKPDVIAAYIRKQNKKDVLLNWSVALKSNTNAKHTWNFNFSDGPRPVGLTERTNISKGRTYILSKGNIQDPPDLYFDLGLKPEKGKVGVPSERVHEARAASGNGLLVIYPLDPAQITAENNPPVIGFYLAFPKIANEELVEFAAQVKPGFEDGQDDDDDDEQP
ncbi:Z1 domain-containing protein [Mucilaginibacter sp. R-33]|uniref:Z1 domain-containing protein n=1 Tax=Mucilaginibacter sp. R-33 TaxID=3416711 RepID=UPI003CFA0F2B